MFLFTVNIFNVEAVDFEADITYETPCEIYAERAASGESNAYGGQYGYTNEEYFNAYVDYLNYCSDVLNNTSNIFGDNIVPEVPVFL